MVVKQSNVILLFLESDLTRELKTIQFHGEVWKHVTNVALIILRYYTQFLDNYLRSYALFLNPFFSDQNTKQKISCLHSTQFWPSKILTCRVCYGQQNEPKFAQFG